MLFIGNFKSPLNSHVSSNYVREGQKLYVIKEGKKKLICHADINGAMNIVRKVIPEFNIETIRNASKKHEDKEQIKKIYNYRIVCLSNYSINTIKKSLFAEIKI